MGGSIPGSLNKVVATVQSDLCSQSEGYLPNKNRSHEDMEVLLELVGEQWQPLWLTGLWRVSGESLVGS